MKTQKEKILDHIKQYGKITSYEAFVKYHITRLSARIYDLRHDGYPIVSKMVTKKDKDGSYVNYDEYSLEESA